MVSGFEQTTSGALSVMSCQAIHRVCRLTPYMQEYSDPSRVLMIASKPTVRSQTLSLGSRRAGSRPAPSYLVLHCPSTPRFHPGLTLDPRQ